MCRHFREKGRNRRIRQVMEPPWVHSGTSVRGWKPSSKDCPTTWPSSSQSNKKRRVIRTAILKTTTGKWTDCGTRRRNRVQPRKIPTGEQPRDKKLKILKPQVSKIKLLAPTLFVKQSKSGHYKRGGERAHVARLCLHHTVDALTLSVSPPFSDTSEEVNQSQPVDNELLELLGEDPTTEVAIKPQFHEKLSIRWNNSLGNGIKKETKRTLLKKYSRSGDCEFEPPALNLEVKVQINEAARKRDAYYCGYHTSIGSATAALGAAITMVLTDNFEKRKLLELMGDSGSLLTDLHHQLTSARRALILPGIDKKVKDVFERSEPGKKLFGDGLGDELKAAKAMEKLVITHKPAPQPKPQGNWKGPSGKETPRTPGNTQPKETQQQPFKKKGNKSKQWNNTKPEAPKTQ